ncbi:hypothetical protein ACEQ8H_004657 [Pleosporales sp. CAS-2024a]
MTMEVGTPSASTVAMVLVKAIEPAVTVMVRRPAAEVGTLTTTTVVGTPTLVMVPTVAVKSTLPLVCVTVLRTGVELSTPLAEAPLEVGEAERLPDALDSPEELSGVAPELAGMLEVAELSRPEETDMIGEELADPLAEEPDSDDMGSELRDLELSKPLDEALAEEPDSDDVDSKLRDPELREPLDDALPDALDADAMLSEPSELRLIKVLKVLEILAPVGKRMAELPDVLELLKMPDELPGMLELRILRRVLAELRELEMLMTVGSRMAESLDALELPSMLDADLSLIVDEILADLLLDAVLLRDADADEDTTDEETLLELVVDAACVGFTTTIMVVEEPFSSVVGTVFVKSTDPLVMKLVSSGPASVVVVGTVLVKPIVPEVIVVVSNGSTIEDTDVAAYIDDAVDVKVG